MKPIEDELEYNRQVQALARRAYEAISPEGNDPELAINSLCCLIAALIKSIGLDPESAVAAIGECLLDNLKGSTKAYPAGIPKPDIYFEKKEQLN